MSQSSEAWREIAVACEVARMEIAIETARALDVPLFSRPKIYNWETDGDGRD